MKTIAPTLGPAPTGASVGLNPTPGAKVAPALLPVAVRAQKRLWGTRLLSRPHQPRQKTLGLDRINRFPF
jgi:hypothetical protein